MPKRRGHLPLHSALTIGRRLVEANFSQREGEHRFGQAEYDPDGNKYRHDVHESDTPMMLVAIPIIMAANSNVPALK